MINSGEESVVIKTAGVLSPATSLDDLDKHHRGFPSDDSNLESDSALDDALAYEGGLLDSDGSNLIPSDQLSSLQHGVSGNGGVKLFVGQIPKDMEESYVFPFFSSFGTVTDLTIIRDKNNLSHQGCAFVTYKSSSAAALAVEQLHDKVRLPNSANPLQVRYAESFIEREHKLFIGMLPKTVNEEDLNDMFSPYGDLREIHVIRGTDGSSKGCAFVKFAEREAAIVAIEFFNEYTPPGSTKPLVVKFAVSKKPGRFDISENLQGIPSASSMSQSSTWQSSQDQQMQNQQYQLLQQQLQQHQIIYSQRQQQLQSKVEPPLLSHQLPLQKQIPGQQQLHLPPKPSILEEDNKFIDQVGHQFSNHISIAAAKHMGHPHDTAMMHTYGNSTNVPYPDLYRQSRQSNSSAQYARSGMPQQHIISTHQDPHNWSQHAPQSRSKYNHYSTNQSPALPSFSNRHDGDGDSPYDIHHEGIFPRDSVLRKTNNSTLKPPEGPSGANLFIYHLPRDLTDADLATLFSPFGNIISAKVFIDKKTSDSKGFGFVSYDHAKSAESAISSMNGYQIGSKRLKVQHKRTADNEMANPYFGMTPQLLHQEPLIRATAGTPESLSFPAYALDNRSPYFVSGRQIPNQNPNLIIAPRQSDYRSDTFM